MEKYHYKVKHLHFICSIHNFVVNRYVHFTIHKDQKILFGTILEKQVDGVAVIVLRKFASSSQPGPCLNTSFLLIHDCLYVYLQNNIKNKKIKNND